VVQNQESAGGLNGDDSRDFHPWEHWSKITKFLALPSDTLTRLKFEKNYESDFPSSDCYGFDGIIFEVVRNEVVTTITLF